jgi:hypothetical protein
MDISSQQGRVGLQCRLAMDIGRLFASSEIADLRRGVDEICAILGCYAAYGGNFLQTFRFNLSVPSSGIEFLDPRKWDRQVVPKRL